MRKLIVILSLLLFNVIAYPQDNVNTDEYFSENSIQRYSLDSTQRTFIVHNDYLLEFPSIEQIKNNLLGNGYALNADNNYVVIIVGQSNAAGYPSTDSCFNQYRSNANCKIFNGTTWEILDVVTNSNQYPSKAGLFAYEMSLAYSIQNYTKGNVYVIKYAIGGTAMENFWKVGETGYTNAITTINDALTSLTSSGINYNIVGYFFYQGESDCTASYAPLYSASLLAMCTQTRIDISQPALPYYLVRIHKDVPYTASYVAQVRAADSTFVAGDGGLSQWVSVDDLPRYTGSAHISALSQITLGIRLSNLTTPNLNIKKYHP